MSGNSNGQQGSNIILGNVRLGMGRPLTISVQAAIDRTQYGDVEPEYYMALALVIDSHPYQQTIPLKLQGHERVKAGSTYSWKLPDQVDSGCSSPIQDPGNFCIHSFDKVNTIVKSKLTYEQASGAFAVHLLSTSVFPEWTIGSMDITLIDPTDTGSQ